MSNPIKQSEFFTEGENALDEGIEREDCPYDEDSEAAYYWLQGWDKAADECGPDDRYLDDPRRGQATELNRKIR